METTNTPAWSIASEIELVYKSKVKASERPQIKDSKDAYEILMKIWNHDRIDLLEEFKVLFLNRANRVLGVYNLSSGGITGTVCDPRLIFSAALKCNSVSMVLAHNHPSANLRPSRADEELTRRIKEAGTILEIKVIDHIIMSSEGYLSFADEGIL